EPVVPHGGLLSLSGGRMGFLPRDQICQAPVISACDHDRFGEVSFLLSTPQPHVWAVAIPLSHLNRIDPDNAACVGCSFFAHGLRPLAPTKSCCYLMERTRVELASEDLAPRKLRRCYTCSC